MSEYVWVAKGKERKCRKQILYMEGIFIIFFSLLNFLNLECPIAMDTFANKQDPISAVIS